MFQKIMNNVCKDCGAVMELVAAGIKKNGEPYNAFMGCQNWREHKKFGGGSTAKAQFKTSPQPPQASTPSLNVESVQMIMDELLGLNKRLNDMANFLVDKLGGDKKEEVDVKDIKF